MTDLDRLQGVWRQIHSEADGQPNVTDDYGAATTTFEGDTFTVRDSALTQARSCRRSTS